MASYLWAFDHPFDCSFVHLLEVKNDYFDIVLLIVYSQMLKIKDVYSFSFVVKIIRIRVVEIKQ